eukprot:s447_g30.t1
MYLFTDASFNSEARDGGLGAVLLDQRGHVVKWFGCAAPRDLCDSFMAEEQEQAIGRGGRDSPFQFVQLLAHRPPMDQQFVAHLHALQRVMILQQMVRYALMQVADVADNLETHAFTNAHWKARVELARRTFRDLDTYVQRQINQLLEELHDLFRAENQHGYGEGR